MGDINNLLDKLEIKKNIGNRVYHAICPSHDDKKASLTITKTEDNVIFHCFANCKPEEILRSVGLEWKDILPEREKKTNGKTSYTLEQISNWPTVEVIYQYHDKKNLPYMLVVRKEGKDFIQYSYQGDGLYKAGLGGQQVVPYKLPEVLKAIEKQELIFIPEGEKDCNNLFNKFRLTATTNSGGANNWKKCLNKHFKNADVVLLPDNDDAGEKHIKDIIEGIEKIAKRIRILRLPGIPLKGDVSDWIEAGGTKEELLKLVELSEVYVKKEEKRIVPQDGNYRPENIYTQQSDASNFAEENKEKIKYCHCAKSWYIWNGKRWERDTTEQIHNFIQDYILTLYKKASDIEDKEKRLNLIQHSIRAENKKYQAGVLELARCKSGIAITPGEFDTDLLFLNVKNGIVNLETGELLPHNSNKMITKFININYNPAAPCDRFKKFLNEIFKNDQALIEYVVRALGYSLSGLTTEQCFFICYGQGQNGKSTLLSLIQEIMADYQQQIPAETLLRKNTEGSGANNDIAKLKGARFVSASEVDEGKSLSEPTVKRLTGGDVITARFLHQEYFDYIFIGKIWMATNHKPNYSADPAMNRRIKLIPFDYTVSEENKDYGLLDKLREEKEGILALLVAGCMRYRSKEDGGLKEPESVKVATSIYKSENDLIQRFIDDYCLVGKDYFQVTSSALGKAFSDWCIESGEKEVSTDAFFKKLKYRGFTNKRSSLNGKRSRVWVGISLLDNTLTSIYQDSDKEVDTWTRFPKKDILFPIQASREKISNCLSDVSRCPEEEIDEAYDPFSEENLPWGSN